MQVSVARVADLDPLELEHTLRGFLLKLQFADAWMKQLPQGAPVCTTSWRSQPFQEPTLLCSRVYF